MPFRKNAIILSVIVSMSNSALFFMPMSKDVLFVLDNPFSMANHLPLDSLFAPDIFFPQQDRLLSKDSLWFQDNPFSKGNSLLSLPDFFHHLFSANNLSSLYNLFVMSALFADSLAFQGNLPLMDSLSFPNILFELSIGYFSALPFFMTPTSFLIILSLLAAI
jgi:hypothetical protein